MTGGGISPRGITSVKTGAGPGRESDQRLSCPAIARMWYLRGHGPSEARSSSARVVWPESGPPRGDRAGWPYAAAKAGVIQADQGLGVHLARRECRVNAVLVRAADASTAAQRAGLRPDPGLDKRLVHCGWTVRPPDRNGRGRCLLARTMSGSNAGA